MNSENQIVAEGEAEMARFGREIATANLKGLCERGRKL